MVTRIQRIVRSTMIATAIQRSLLRRYSMCLITSRCTPTAARAETVTTTVKAITDRSVNTCRGESTGHREQQRGLTVAARALRQYQAVAR